MAFDVDALADYSFADIKKAAKHAMLAAVFGGANYTINGKSLGRITTDQAQRLYDWAVAMDTTFVTQQAATSIRPRCLMRCPLDCGQYYGRLAPPPGTKPGASTALPLSRTPARRCPIALAPVPGFAYTKPRCLHEHCARRPPVRNGLGDGT